MKLKSIDRAPFRLTDDVEITLVVDSRKDKEFLDQFTNIHNWANIPVSFLQGDGIGKHIKKCNEKLIKEGKVIYQDKNTILKIGNQTYIAKPEKGDKFDAEKGLLICMMKAVGFTTSDFLELFAKAKYNTTGKKNESKKRK